MIIFDKVLFIDYEKLFDTVTRGRLWKIMGIKGYPDHLCCINSFTSHRPMVNYVKSPQLNYRCCFGYLGLAL